MAWETITAALLQRRMPSDYGTLQKAAEQKRMDWDTTVEEVIESVVNEVRGYVAAWRSNSLGSEGTVPPELVRVTITKCRLELIAILPNTGIMADDLRRSTEKRADETLREVAKGNFAVSPPSDAPASAPAAAPPLVGGDLATPWPDTPYGGSSSIAASDGDQWP